MSKFTHFDKDGKTQMVDVSSKPETKRVAIAMGSVKVKKETLDAILDKKINKGDVLEVARIAGIMGGKKTPDLIPMCHPLLISKIKIQFSISRKENLILIYALAKTTGKTGIEVEALTAVSVAGLTIYDMCKAMDRSIEIGEIKLLKKSGGKSGLFVSSELKGRISKNDFEDDFLVKGEVFTMSLNAPRLIIDPIELDYLPVNSKLKIGSSVLLKVIKKEIETSRVDLKVLNKGKILLNDEVEVYL